MATELGMNPGAQARIDPRKLRHPPEKDDLALNAAGQALVASIEESARPTELASTFPRIVNRLAKLWRAPLQVDRRFEELLTDGRGHRQGFPLGVLMGLGTLRGYFQTSVVPTRRDVWDSEQKLKGR